MMTPFEYLCFNTIHARIREHINLLLEEEYAQEYKDYMDGFHADVKGLITGQVYSASDMVSVDGFVLAGVQQWVSDGNALLYEDDIVGFLSSLGIDKDFIYPSNADNPVDFYNSLISSELYDLYKRYLEKNRHRFFYRHKALDNHRWAVELIG